MAGIFSSRIRNTLVIFIFLLALAARSYGQQVNGIQKLNSFADSLSRNFPVEKIYVQTDKSMYNTGDTIWLKGYLFEADYLTPSAKSGLVNIDIVGNDNKIIGRTVFRATTGLFRGSVPLKSDDLLRGDFSLRAYTNWMRNWGTDYVFTKKLYFDHTEAALAEKNSGKAPVRKSRQLNSGVLLSRQDIDLQFMPEGGSLVNGLPSRVGFKALTESGLGIDVSGKIFDGKQRQVASFKTTYAGMGSFEFTPIAGETYYATIADVSKRYVLPKASESGAVLRVDNDFQGEQLKLSIRSSGPAAATYYLIAQSQGVVCYGAIVKRAGKEAAPVIPKEKFPTGIVRITLFDENMNPVNERITFIDHRDELNIQLLADKETYVTRDSVRMKVKVTDKSGTPVQGSFSLAVTDDGLAISDTSRNILTHLLLTGDLKGTVENPAYYLLRKPENWQALESLMLTQGWIGYRWNREFNFPQVKYAAQQDFTVKGKLINLMNKGVPDIRVKLFSKKPFFILDTLTDQAGEFSFTNFPEIDTASFLLQAVDKKGRTKAISFLMPDEQPLPLPAPLKNKPAAAIDTTRQVVLRNNADVKQKAEEILTGKNVLKEVVVTRKKAVKGSRNLNGPGNADQVIDEQEMLKAGKMSLTDLLYQKVTGFREGTFPVRITEESKASFLVRFHRARFIFDGVDAETFFLPAGKKETRYERFFYLKGLIDQFSAEDIRGIEVMYNSQYNNRYNASISAGELTTISPVNDKDYTYIEITTRSGRGPFTNARPGFYSYKPLTPAWSKEFYKPKYQNRDAVLKTDFRSTIHWEPDVITDATGEATIKFFTSDRTGSYTIFLEGSTMNGLIGKATDKLLVR